MCVWWEEKGLLCPGDNIYCCFPSLYPIRGSSPREPLVWANSLKKMAALKPEILCPAHSMVVRGKEVIQDLLQVFMDGIHYVHDQTVR